MNKNEGRRSNPSAALKFMPEQFNFGINLDGGVNVVEIKEVTVGE